MGSVIFKSGRILSFGYNTFRHSSIPSQYKKFDHTLHAEQAALMGVNWEKLRGCSILVIRMNISGNLSLGYPCEYCMESIRHVGIKFLYYSNRKSEIVRERV